jgi:hypothetical protein
MKYDGLIYELEMCNRSMMARANREARYIDRELFYPVSVACKKAAEALAALQARADTAEACLKESENLRRIMRGDISDAQARIAALEEALPNREAVDALANYQQADEDGVMVLASRQAIDECLPLLRAALAKGEK